MFFVILLPLYTTLQAISSFFLTVSITQVFNLYYSKNNEFLPNSSLIPSLQFLVRTYYFELNSSALYRSIQST